ncbi:MAG: amidophosphoribosyltransferase [Erysipelotrichaceae bacterium]|nr:amidophosphoribosyltransferase [Erysipelotrichaceae bacterium]
MGGFFGAVSKRDITIDVFFGTDYHSHLGTKNAGMAILDEEYGFRRYIHSIENTPFRSKFEKDLMEFKGNAGIGCISDSDPQPLLIRSKNGCFAISTIGVISNGGALIREIFSDNGHQFTTEGKFEKNGTTWINMTELTAALINQKDDLLEGIKYAQEVIDGSITILILTDKGELICVRDKYGRLPVHIGKDEDGYCVSFESFAYGKLGYHDEYELGPREIVKLTPDKMEILSERTDDLKICAFLWTYYGYPNSNYEGVNVEVSRYKNGALMAQREKREGTLPDVDFVAGVPDSGVPHAIGYANESGKNFARPFVKYTPTWPRSFMPSNQAVRNHVAKMKQIPVPELIEGKKLLFVDDSIVRGTQLRETVDFLFESGAKEVHMRSACPPIMYPCKYLNFSRGNSEMDLIARKTIQELEGDEGQKHIAEYADQSTERGKCLLHAIAKKFGFDSLGYQDLNDLLDSIGIDKNKICTYCWTGKE